MNTAIVLDHGAATLQRFWGGTASDALRREVSRWCGAVRTDSLDLLEELVQICEQRSGLTEEEFATRVSEFAEREEQRRQALAPEGAFLEKKMEESGQSSRAGSLAVSSRPGARSSIRAQRAVAVVLAGMTTACNLRPQGDPPGEPLGGRRCLPCAGNHWPRVAASGGKYRGGEGGLQGGEAGGGAGELPSVGPTGGEADGPHGREAGGLQGGEAGGGAGGLPSVGPTGGEADGPHGGEAGGGAGGLQGGEPS